MQKKVFSFWSLLLFFLLSFFPMQEENKITSIIFNFMYKKEITRIRILSGKRRIDFLLLRMMMARLLLLFPVCRSSNPSDLNNQHPSKSYTLMMQNNNVKAIINGLTFNIDSCLSTTHLYEYKKKTFVLLSL